MIVCPSADLHMALRAIVFSAVGTAGQRCTSLRRVIVHEQVYATLIEKLKKAYASLKIGSPLDESVLVGPLIGRAAFLQMESALVTAREEGARYSVANGSWLTSTPTAITCNPRSLKCRTKPISFAGRLLRRFYTR